jgi:hypothetical protein
MWMALLWATSVAALGVVLFIIKVLMNAVGLSIVGSHASNCIPIEPQ